ncbi:MAG: histidine--tRNA ligase [bacterium]
MAAIKPSLPKGTRDFLPEQMVKRQFVIDSVRDIFETYGYQPLETPSIEKLNVLSGKYGDEGEKLIFKVLRRGTGLEQLQRGQEEFVVKHYGDLVEEALRYDLTVPLSRVVAMYQNELTFPFKRYQIQPVWRADRPQRGRYREFYQCDVDTVGTPSMLADAETIAIVHDVLSTLGFDKFTIRINNRKILTGILEYAGIEAARGGGVLVAIDKLDKVGLDGVKRELTAQGHPQEAIKKILSILALEGKPDQVLSHLADAYGELNSLRQGVEELMLLMSHLDGLQVVPERLQVDLYLVRGLGYYTGPIHESVVTEPKMGSLSGGGRYDRLIGTFLGRDIPATGTAFGIERIIDVMSELDMFPGTRTKTEVLVAYFDETTLQASLAFGQALRNSGLKTETYLDKSKLKKQFSYANKKQIPFVALIGPDEQTDGLVTLKNMDTQEQRTVSQPEAVQLLKDELR